MIKLYCVSCYHPCYQLRERDGVTSSVSSSVVTGGGGGCHCRCEWITVDELGLSGVGDNGWM